MEVRSELSSWQRLWFIAGQVVHLINLHFLNREKLEFQLVGHEKRCDFSHSVLSFYGEFSKVMSDRVKRSLELLYLSCLFSMRRLNDFVYFLLLVLVDYGEFILRRAVLYFSELFIIFWTFLEHCS